MTASILDRRFVIVAGKGGVGKSTVSAALAMVGARRGQRVLVAELGSKEKVATLLGHPRQVGYAPTRIKGDWAGSIDVINVTPAKALHEYGVMKLRFETLYKMVFENPLMKSLTRMIPGMNELVLIGKAWHLERETVAGRPRWDVVIVDSPATGHGVSLLVLPHVVTETVKSGPMYEETSMIRDMLIDPERSVMNIVTLPEEMPSNEAAELRDHMDTQLRIAPGRLFINGVWPEQPAAPELAALETWHADLEPDSPLQSVFRTMRFSTQKRAAQEHYLNWLAQNVAMDGVRIPYQFAPGVGSSEVDAISRLIESV